MRKISVVLVAAMLLSVGSLFANPTNDVDPSNNLSAQISELLKDNSFGQDEVDLAGQVRFTLNQDRQIVVLSVDTDDAELEGFVKSRLNYKEVQLDGYKEGKLYTVPVRIVG